MKKLGFLFLFFAFIEGRAQSPDPHFIEKVAFSESQLYQKSARFTESAEAADYDLFYQKLNFTVDPAVNYIAGSVHSSVEFLKDNISQIKFDLVSTMVVDSVWYNRKKSMFQHSGNKISIPTPVAMPKSSTASIDVFYHGSPPQSGFGSFFVSTHNNIPALWTLSEPYGAMDWWPCKQSLADKIDSIDVFVTCPAEYKAASNGKLISDQVNGSDRIAHWKHRYPIATYLVAIAVTNYSSYSDFLDLPNGNKLEILNYVYPEYLTTAKTKSEEILSIMNFYNTKFITYPFADEKYGHAQFGWSGGMEHQTMSFMQSLEYDLVAHEMAHQWFGDYITLASWHDIWLNEGFATYLTGLVYENLQDEKWGIWKSQILNSVTSRKNGSVYVADTTDVSRIFSPRLSYSKGASLLHMLRWEMGDELFFKGMKNYLNDPAIANGFAIQDKFVKHMETAADTSFTNFFNDWYYGQGYPIYQFTSFPDPTNPNIQNLRVSQTSSDPSVPFFEMHIPIRVWKGGKYTDLRLHNTLQNQEFRISDQSYDRLEFDPEIWLIAKFGKVVPAQTIAQNNEIRISPESIACRLFVQVPGQSGQALLKIYDLSGRTISSSLLPPGDSYVDIKNLQKGLCLAEVRIGSQSKTVKFVNQ